MSRSAVRKSKPYKGIAMEGAIAENYAKNTRASLAEFRALAGRIAGQLKPGDVVLEIAPGPGYLAIELAKLGTFRIAAVDISASFVRIAAANAAEAGVEIEFREGNASALPYAGNWFNFIVNRAAFKNFSDPVGALREMHRVLTPGGTALIIDLRRNASNAAIAREVADMDLGMFASFTTRFILRWLRRRAYSREEFEKMLDQVPFGAVDIAEEGMGFEIRLTK